MEKRNPLNLMREGWIGLLIATLIGSAGYGINVVTEDPIADPLLVAMIMGIIVKTAIGRKERLTSGFAVALRIFIPLGVVFYAAQNLNFAKLAKVETSMIALLIVVMLVYFGSILLLGKLLGQRKQITYLTATGSAICGASAIAITSPAVEAEPDDISISLLSVTLTAVVGTFIVFPFLAIFFDITNRTYGLLSGAILQFTGFVKVAVKSMPPLTEVTSAKELLPFAVSVKTARYLGLLIAIPLFASLKRKNIFIPWFLWAFLGAGLIGTWIYVVNETFYTEELTSFIGPIYNIFWSIAMAAVGLNADVKQLLSNNGTKAMIMAFGGFVAATVAFYVGLSIISMF